MADNNCSCDVAASGLLQEITPGAVETREIQEAFIADIEIKQIAQALKAGQPHHMTTFITQTCETCRPSQREMD